MARELVTVREHGYKVAVLSESTKGNPVFAHIGSRRWECEWYELTKGARKRREADPNYEHDHDRDETCCVSVHPSKEAAIENAKKVAPDSVYGSAIVQQHEVQYLSEEDEVGEWEPIGPQWEVDGAGGVMQTHA